MKGSIGGVAAVTVFAAACAVAAAAGENSGGPPPVTDSLRGDGGVRIQTLCTHCNSSNIQVGGRSKELVPILRNGFPLFGGLATSFVLTTLPPDAIAEAKVTKGPGDPALPAAAAGGVIRITESLPEELPTFDVSGVAGSYNLTALTARGAGPISRSVSASLLAGVSMADPVDDDGDGWNDVPAIDRRYADGRLLITPVPEHRVDVGLSWIEEDDALGRGAFDFGDYLTQYLDWMYDSGPPPRAVWTREDTVLERTEYRVGWDWEISSDETLAIRLLGAERDQSVSSQLTSDPDSRFSEFFERFVISESDRFGSASWSKHLGSSLKLNTRAETAREEVSAFTRNEPGATPGPPAIDFVDSRAVSLDVEWELSKIWKLHVGARYENLAWGAEDENVERTFSGVLPRMALRFRPSPNWTFRLVGGRTARAPWPIFGEVCCGQDYQRSFRARLESGVTYAIEAVFQPSPTLRVGAYGARTGFDDHLLKLVGWSAGYVQTYALANIDDARADSAELTLGCVPTRRVELDASVGWVSLFNTGEENVTITVTPPSFTDPFPGGVVRPIRRIPYQATRSGFAGVRVDAGRGVWLSLQGIYTGPMLIQEFDADPMNGQENGTNLLLAEMRETPGFSQLNASMQIILRRNLVLTAAVENLSAEIQNDLGDPTTDYNWGPLTGRSWRVALRYHLDRP